MKIEGWLIERFGALRNYAVRDLPDGLTVLYGPNGSGKSTLFGFLRQMLFARSRSDGGVDGVRRPHDWRGRLSCVGPNGLYTISRASDASSGLHVTRPDGQEGDEYDLECLLGGADGRLVGPLLAFDVDDLRAPGPGRENGIQERFLTIRGANAGATVERALATVRSRLSQLGEQIGDGRDLLATPVELQARIDRATRAAQRYCQLMGTQAHRQVEVEHRARAASDLRLDKARYDVLVELWPTWQEADQAQRQLEHFEPIDEFPADGEQRLVEALAARQAAQGNLEQLTDDAAVRRRDRPAPDDGGLSVEIEALVDTAARQSERLQKLADLRTDLTQAQAHSPEPGDRSAPGHEGQSETVERVHASTESLIAWQRRLKEAVEAARDRQGELEATKRQVLDLESVESRILDTLGGPEPPSVAVIDKEARLLQHVRAALTSLGGDQTATERWQDLIAKHSASIRELESNVRRLPSVVLFHAAWVTVVLGMAAAGWRYTLGDTLGLAILSVVALASGLGASVQRSRRARSAEDETRRRSSVVALHGEFERACQGLKEQQERATRRKFSLSVDSARLGLPPMPSDRQLQDRQAELEEQWRRRCEWDDAQNALADTRTSLASGREVEQQQAEALLTAQREQRQAIQEWHQWKVDAGLADNGDAAGHAAEAAGAETERLRNCRRLRGLIAEHEREVAAWSARARAALAKAHDPQPDSADQTLVEQVVLCQARLLQARAERANQPEEPPPAVQAARRRLTECEAALGRLLAEGGASDEAEFHARLETYRRRQALHTTIRSCESRLNERLSHEPTADDVRSELSRGRVEEWRNGAARASTALTDMEASCTEARRALAHTEADVCAAAAEAADLPLLEAERAGLATEAAETIQEWRTLAVTAALLADAHREVERECQPAVLRRASQALSAVTASRYECRLQSGDRGGLVVIDRKGGMKPVEQLSRTAVEQLHFCLRLGLAEEVARRGTVLPLVMDDVLDTFDPERGRAMAQQVVELSRRHQILLFTCRPETRDLLCDLNPGTNVVVMQEL